MTAIGWLINIIQRGTVSLQRLDKIFREIPGVVDPVETAPIGRLEGNLEISNLTFTYPGADKPVLKGINLILKKDRSLALVGKTGSGKTTLVSLLLRLYNPPPGSILMDGIDLNKIPLKTLRQAIGYVPQDNFLFSTTIHENIGFAGESFSDQAIEEVAKQAQIYESIVDFPEKFQTVVGERGTTLSGGQKQRISIARALIKNPALLILDDCFSAVDTQTEEKILTGLRSYLSGRTGIIISHRISTVQEADEIVLLDHGEIIERGDHHTLLQLKGRYWEMYQKQRLEEELASVE
jgi:ATP-binding cassette subfamily B protein